MNFFKVKNSRGWVNITIALVVALLLGGYFWQAEKNQGQLGSGENSFQTLSIPEKVSIKVLEPEEEEVGTGALGTTLVPNAPVPVIEISTSGSLFEVVKVVDGDTITVSIDGKNETLRLIGLNTPETVDPRKPVECFGREASARAKELLSGQSVYLEADPSQGERDKYNRLLRYVYLSDYTLYNKQMIIDGFAYEYTYNTPYKYQTEFKHAENFARENKLGLWADGVCEEQKEIEPGPKPEASAPATGPYNCSANVYNCPNFSTQAEAQAVYEACGGPATDIHKLDGNSDGLACETLP